VLHAIPLAAAMRTGGYRTGEQHNSQRTARPGIPP